MSATEGYGVTRTLRTLELLAVRPHSSGELADLVGMHQRTARRVLARLIDEGYVERLDRPRIRYALTPRLAVLGARALRQLEAVRLTTVERDAPAAPEGATSGPGVASP